MTSMAKGASMIILRRVVGFVIFLVILAVANALIPSFGNSLYSGIVLFFDANILLFFVMMLIGLINDLFWSFPLPFSLIAPLTSTVLSILIVAFVFRVFDFLGSYVPIPFSLPVYIVYPLVAAIVFVSGYLTIIFREEQPREKKEPKPRKRRPDWEDVLHEWRQAAYDLAIRIRKNIRKKRKKKS